MDHSYHSIPLERYSYSIIPISSPNAKDWIHHPARDHLSLVFERQNSTNSTTTGYHVKVIWKTDVLVCLDISKLKGQRNPVFGPHLVVTSKNPLISIKCLQESSQEVRVVQVKLKNNEAYTLALMCFRQEGCTVRELNTQTPLITTIPPNTRISTQQPQTPSNYDVQNLQQTFILPSSRSNHYFDSSQIFQDRSSFQPGRAVTTTLTPQQQSRRWQTDSRPYVQTMKNRDDSGLGDSQLSTRTQDPYNGGIPRALLVTSSNEYIQAPLRPSTQSQTNIDIEHRFGADSSSRTYSPVTVDTACEDEENRLPELDLLVDEWNRDLHPRGRKEPDPKLRTRNTTKELPITRDLAKANKKRTRVTESASSTKRARTGLHKNRKAPHSTKQPRVEDVASNRDADSEVDITDLESVTRMKPTPTPVTKKVKPIRTKATVNTITVPSSNDDLKDNVETSISGTSTNEMSELFGAEVLDKLLKGEKLPEIDSQIKRKQLIEWLHEPEGPGSFMQLAEDMERLWELDIVAATKSLFDQKRLEN